MKIIRSFESFNITRKMPVNASLEDYRFFKHRLAATVEKISVLQLSKVNVVSQGIIFKGLSVYNGLSLHNDDGLLVEYTFFHRLKILFLRKRIKLDKNVPYILVDNIYSHTYYHWMTEALPRLFLVKDYIPNSVLLLPNNHNKTFHLESMNIFGVQGVEYMEKEIRYEVMRLTVATQIGRMANYHPIIVKEMAAYIKGKIDCHLNLGERIYVSRARAAVRKVTNEADVIALMKEYGFVIVKFEDYSFAQQVSIARHCRYMIGAHGAGLTNMIFMNDESVVMELRKADGGENYFYFSLASTFDHHYYYQFCKSVEIGSVQECDIVVDVEELKENLKLMGL